MTKKKRLRRNVIRFRDLSGVSQAELGRRLGLHPSTMSRWLSKDGEDQDVGMDPEEAFEAYLRELLALIRDVLDEPSSSDPSSSPKRPLRPPTPPTIQDRSGSVARSQK